VSVKYIHMSVYTCIYINVYICVCACVRVCVCEPIRGDVGWNDRPIYYLARWNYLIHKTSGYLLEEGSSPVNKDWSQRAHGVNEY